MLTYRKLGPDDHGLLRRIRRQALREIPNYFGRAPHEEEAQPDAYFRQHIETSLVFGAFAGGEIVGMAALEPNKGERRKHKAMVWGVYIEPDYRGKGAASALMACLEQDAAVDIVQLMLDVNVRNAAAVALYEKLGFRIYATEPRARRIDGEYHDEYLMIRFLDGYGG